MKKFFDVIVVGGGHAGCEAASAAARVGAKTCMITQSKITIGEMSCNPSIGGVAKGIIVREVDALGGLMGQAADLSGIHYKMLNKSKGPAVWGPRAQADRALYRKAMQDLLFSHPNLYIMEGEVTDLLIENNIIQGVILDENPIKSPSVVLTTGTFLGGVIHIGKEQTPGGRFGENPSIKLSNKLRSTNITIKRLKTGTPPRIYADSINWNILESQKGDNPPIPFSDLTDYVKVPQIDCYITYTNQLTHKLILDNLDQSPMYSGQISAVGPRYCPSIEDKIVRFKDKERHQIFLEPEGLNDNLVYPNGISTSLPHNIQVKLVQSLAGLENAKIARSGYAIEYDYVDPTELKETLETKKIKGLFLAGQINGTTGYEEAAGQGLVAGANAALSLDQKSLILNRSESYIGVMINDLTCFGTSEPYRMMTSRSEYRILLRPENAAERLHEKAKNLKLLSTKRIAVYNNEQEKVNQLKAELNRIKISPEDALDYGVKLSAENSGKTLLDILSFPQFDCSLAAEKIKDYDSKILHKIRASSLYYPYEIRQRADIEMLHEDMNMEIPRSINYKVIGALSNEVASKLSHFRPNTIAEAKRIQGITPTAMIALQLYIKRYYD